MNSSQPKIRTKVQLTVGWSKKPLTELVEIAQHHWDWDNTEQRIHRMHEMLMVSEVCHYTGRTSRGERSGRGRFQKERGCQRRWPTQHEKSHRPPFSNQEKCFLCGELRHWVRNCPIKAAQCAAPPSNSNHENCFLCGEPGHWVRNCPDKTAPLTLPRHLHQVKKPKTN